MKTLDDSEKKIQEIAEQLRHQALEPAKKQAEEIIEEAKTAADKLIDEAKKQCEVLIASAKAAIEQEKSVFHSSMVQSGKQAIESIRQAIEHTVFNDQLESALNQKTKDPEVIAKFINAVIEAIKKEGLSNDLSLVIPKQVTPESLSTFLAGQVLERLKKGPIEVGGFPGGVQVKLVDKKMTIDLTDDTLKELISGYVRKDFRKMLFAKN